MLLADNGDVDTNKCWRVQHNDPLKATPTRDCDVWLKIEL